MFDRDVTLTTYITTPFPRSRTTVGSAVLAAIPTCCDMGLTRQFNVHLLEVIFRFLLTLFKEAAGNILLQLADTRRM
jgi:hypothetical protein